MANPIPLQSEQPNRGLLQHITPAQHAIARRTIDQRRVAAGYAPLYGDPSQRNHPAYDPRAIARELKAQVFAKQNPTATHDLAEAEQPSPPGPLSQNGRRASEEQSDTLSCNSTVYAGGEGKSQPTHNNTQVSLTQVSPTNLNCADPGLPRTVKLYSELGRLADAIREDRLLRVWYGLRALDANGQGWLPDDAITRQHLLTLGVAPSAQSLRKAISRGEGAWWRRARHHQKQPVIQLLGLQAVTLRLTGLARAQDLPYADGNPGRSIEEPITALGGALADWRGVLMRVWLAGAKNQQRRLDRQYLTTAWGRASRHTLRNRCLRGGVEIIANYAYVPVSAYSPDGPYDLDHLMSTEGASLTVIDGRRCLLWQRPNTYRSSAQRACTGMTRRVKRHVRQALDIPQRVYAPRQYHDQPNAFARARNRAPGLELYLLHGNYAYGGLWEIAPAYAGHVSRAPRRRSPRC